MGRVGAGDHAPFPALIGIPAEGELNQHAAFGAVEIGAGVIPGAHHIIDFQLFRVDLIALGVQLPAALEILAVADRHGVIAIGKGVIVFRSVPVVLDRVGGRRGEKRLGHSGLRVVRSDLAVARSAGLRGQPRQGHPEHYRKRANRGH
jgi:hypothetical protein